MNLKKKYFYKIYSSNHQELVQNKSGASSIERLLEGATKALSDWYVREDGDPFRQRLLVLENRLSVWLFIKVRILGH